MKQAITIDEFASAADKLEIKIGTITDVERIPKNKKMIKMVVNFGDDVNKTVISNIGGNMEDVNQLKGLNFPFCINLFPAERNGFISEAMILADIKDGSFNFNLNTGYQIL